MPHPPYSSNLTPRTFFLFPQMKKVLRGKHFDNVEAVKQKMAEALKGIQINEFKQCFEQWKKHLTGALHKIGITANGTEV